MPPAWIKRRCGFMRKVITIICMLVMLIVPCWSYSEKTTLVTNWGVYSSLLEEYEKEHPDIQISKDETVIFNIDSLLFNQ